MATNASGLTTDTVLVLGAGASVDYDFPTGDGLRELLIRSLQTDGSIVRKILTNASFPPYPTIILKELLNLGKYLDQADTKSIDRFLELRANKRLDFIGKLAIAVELSQFEIPSQINRRQQKPRNGWYSHFLNHLDFYTSQELAERRVSVITFNYDRSLEFYLRSSLSARFPNEDVDDVMAAIPIIHVHGQIGHLRGASTEESKNRAYNQIVEKDDAFKAAEGIELVRLGQPTSEAFSLAQVLLRSAKIINFIGFGFDRENLRRLSGNVSFTFPDIPKINGMMFGATPEERKTYEKNIRSAFGIGDGTSERERVLLSNANSITDWMRSTHWLASPTGTSKK